MKKLNIKDLLLDIDLVQLINLDENNYTLKIDIDGNLYINEENDIKKPIVFENKNFKKLFSNNEVKQLAQDLFISYKPVVTGTVCKIKPLNNWQNIIDMNKENMLYFDHQSDGVEIFEDKELEDYGWQASALEINYRQIADFIEQNCDGVLVCYDNEVQFNGFVFVDDIVKVRQQVKDFIIAQAKQNIEDKLIELDDDDAIEALEFFGIED